MTREACHTRKYTGERPKGRGKVVGATGAGAEINYRVLTSISNDRFVEALGRVGKEHLPPAVMPDPPSDITPHERNMERVRNGAGISTVIPFTKAEPAYSLTGGSSRWMAS